MRTLITYCNMQFTALNSLIRRNDISFGDTDNLKGLTYLSASKKPMGKQVKNLKAPLRLEVKSVLIVEVLFSFLKRVYLSVTNHLKLTYLYS